MAFDVWTLVLQAINVLVLVWLLGRFFYRPVAAIVEKRQMAVQKLLKEAETARDATQKARADIAATRQGFVSERTKILEDARKEADTARAGIVQDAREEAAKLKAEREADWQRERAALEETLTQRAGTVAVEIARRLLQRLPPATATGVFVDSLCARIRDLSEQTRALLASSADRGVALEIVSASALDDAQKARCADALKSAAGRDVTLNYRIDPNLIAGIEIRGPEIVLRDSWRHDLDHVLAELKQDVGTSGQD